MAVNSQEQSQKGELMSKITLSTSGKVIVGLLAFVGLAYASKYVYDRYYKKSVNSTVNNIEDKNTDENDEDTDECICDKDE